MAGSCSSLEVLAGSADISSSGSGGGRARGGSRPRKPLLRAFLSPLPFLLASSSFGKKYSYESIIIITNIT